jgi:hypothetical protein
VAIARRTSTTVTKAASSTSYGMTWPVVPTNGDLLIAVISGGVQSTITPPAGWTLLLTQDAAAAQRGWLYTKTAASEVAAQTWTLGSATKGTGWMGAYSGADVASVGYASNASLVTPKIVVPAGGWMVVAAGGRHTNTGITTTWTSNDDGLDTKLLDFGSNVAASQDLDGCVYDTGRAMLGSIYGRILTATNDEATAISFAVAFGPSSGPPATPAKPGSGNRFGVHL